MILARRRRLNVFLGAALAVLLASPVARAQQSGQAEKKEHAFKGVVQNVDAKAKTLIVANETIPGWMNAMSMTYGVDKEAVLKQLKVGDQITAKVYDGDYKTLYNVQIVPPKKK